MKKDQDIVFHFHCSSITFRNYTGRKILDISNICNINLLGNASFGHEAFKVMEAVVVASMSGEF